MRGGERERERDVECMSISLCVYVVLCSSLLIENTYGECVKMPDRLFLILQDDCVSAGIPVLSGT